MHGHDVRPSFESSPRLVLGHRDLEPTGDRDWNTDAQFENLGLVDADRIGKTKPSGLRTSQNAQKRGTGSPLVREDDRLVPDDRARMLVTSPITLAISSVSSVYQERASKVFHRTGSCQHEAKQTTVLLALVGLPVLVIGMALCRPFIDFFLGPNWSDAGAFALILAPMLYVRAVVAPISTAYGFARQQKLDLFVTGLPVGLSSVAFLILILTEQPPILAVYLYSASYTLVHAIQGLVAFRISGGPAS